MNVSVQKNLAKLIEEEHTEILKKMLGELDRQSSGIKKFVEEETLKNLLSDLIDDMANAIKDEKKFDSPHFSKIKTTLDHLNQELIPLNVEIMEIAKLIKVFKKILFELVLTKEEDSNTQTILQTSEIFDHLLTIQFKSYMDIREHVIIAQKKALAEVEVPVVKIWERILLLPITSMLDSNRTQRIMEKILSEIEISQARAAIIDISGIPIVDSLVAKHLIQTSSSIKLMGSECIITGIRPNISQTIVNLGIDLTGVITRTTLAEGLRAAMKIVDNH